MDNFKIIPYSSSNAKALDNLCDFITKKFGYESSIPLSIRNSEYFRGFFAARNDKEIVGFVGVVFMPNYAYPFGLRVHPFFFDRGIGWLLSDFISKYSFSLGFNRLVSAYLVDNEAMQIITAKSGYRIIDRYLVVTAHFPLVLPDDGDGMVVMEASEKEISAIMEFVLGTKTGQDYYDSMFLKDLVWYPIEWSDSFVELTRLKRLFMAKKNQLIYGVAIINFNEKQRLLEISRLWGEPLPLVSFLIRIFNPIEIKWCIAENEALKAEKIGFFTSYKLKYDDERAFESRYALIEKRK